MDNQREFSDAAYFNRLDHVEQDPEEMTVCDMCEAGMLDEYETRDCGDVECEYFRCDGFEKGCIQHYDLGITEICDLQDECVAYKKAQKKKGK